MRVALALVLLVACGGDDGSVEPQFRVGACGAGWGSNVGNCQEACRSKATENPDGNCAGHTVRDGETVSASCESTFEWEGLQGCCIPDGNLVVFLQCD